MSAMAQAMAVERAAAVKRRGHVRLIVFVVVLGLAGAVCGIAGLDAVGAPDSARWVLAITLAATLAVVLVGVISHRMTIARIRWRETDAYVARIERESKKYHALMEGAADMLIIVDAASERVRESNAMAREALNLARATPADAAASASSAALGPHVDEIIADEDRERFRAALASAATSPAPQSSLAEVRLRPNAHAAQRQPESRGEHALVADARFAAVDFGGERVVQVSLRDLSKEKEMERQLQIRERLSSIGLLTAGVAHEINNPLEGIGNYIALLEKKDLDERDRQRYLELVRHGFARIADLVRDLLRFARPAAGEGTADLAGVVDRALKLVAYTDPFKGITVAREGLDTSIVVVGDPGRLEQVVFNLLLNAASAMRARGTITIRAQRIEEGSSAMVDLMVEDEGPGIPPENLSKVFDPFFTTSGGTGLGLAVSYGIVRAHGGVLRAENIVPCGARFTIRLPWPAAPAVRHRRKPA
jgi:signal transduction histidine kinase